MRKALAIAALSAALPLGAAAQSNVTLYGIIDLGVQWNESGVNRGTSTTPNWSQESAWSIDSGYQSGSRFGVRGSEALGREWSAVFTLEGGFDASTGMSSQGGRLFGRQAWAGLQQTRIGTVALGRIATPSSGTGAFDLWSPVDPFSAGWGLANLGSTFIPTGGLREDNSIIWASPSWSGVKLALQYSGNVDLGETAPQGTNTSAYNLGANWAWGPLFLAATYDVISYADPGSAGRPGAGNPDQKMLQLGGTFDFKFLKLHGAWADQSNISTAMTVTGIGNGLPTAVVPTGIGYYDNSAWMLGVTVPLFGGNLRGSYQYSDAKNIINGLAQFEPDYYVWGIGYDYPFSRRTNMYIGYAQREWDGRVTQSNGTALPQASQIFDRKQFAVGLRHLF
ncbi:MAG TPA: porin [Burkholderiaceae bacterium]|nr:porin [Burkholderiaceae bacterium]HQR70646.1 porin [Burkholderiaceae bacterium]